MNKQTRHSVFETNSSSTHSISISRTGNRELITPNDCGEIIISMSEFDWEEDVFHDFYTKASYIATSILTNHLKQSVFEDAARDGIIDPNFVIDLMTGHKGYDMCELIYYAYRDRPCDEMQRVIERLAIPRYDEFVDTIKRVTGATSVIILPTMSQYVDHQSSDVFEDAFDDLESYLFNKSSHLITDNDNH